MAGLLLGVVALEEGLGISVVGEVMATSGNRRFRPPPPVDPVDPELLDDEVEEGGEGLCCWNQATPR